MKQVRQFNEKKSMYNAVHTVFALLLLPEVAVQALENPTKCQNTWWKEREKKKRKTDILM